MKEIKVLHEVLEKEMLKVNRKTGKFELVKVPVGWNIITHSNNLDEKINCAQCGRKFLYGDSNASYEIKTKTGKAYRICEACYELEQIRNGFI